MHTSSRLVFLALVLLLVPLAALAVDPPAVIDACVNPGNGNLRIVTASSDCHANETFVQWNIAGPQGPQGPPGPAGPAGSSAGGPPYVWACTPGQYDSYQSPVPRNVLAVFNGSASTANVAVHFLNKDGTNLAGATVPFSNPPETYGGQTGNTTVSLASMHTLMTRYTIGGGNSDDSGDFIATIHVVSDQPVTVGINAMGSGQHLVPCNLLPK